MIELRKKEDLSDLERLSLVNMSFSRFDTFMTCQAKYYYTYIQKEERIFGPAATLGTILHQTLEDSAGTGPLELGQMVKQTKENYKKYDPDGLIDSDLQLGGMEMLQEFYERHKDDPYFISPDKIIANEMSFELIIGSARVIGYIDNVYLDKDNLARVRDWKTGKYQVPDKDVPENLQLGIYALALSQAYPDQEVFPAELYYLRNGKVKGHTFTREDLEVVYERALEQMSLIIETGNTGFNCTNKGFVCRYMCDFGKSGACAKGKYVVDNWGR